MKKKAPLSPDRRYWATVLRALPERALHKLTSWYFSKSALPYWSILALDCAIIVASGMVAVYLRLGGDFLVARFWPYVAFWICTLPAFMVGMRAFHTYSGIIRYSSFIDLMRVTFALLVGVAVMYPVLSLVRWFSLLPPAIYVPWKMLLLMLVIAMLGMWTMRIVVKYLYDSAFKSTNAIPVFIYGVGEGGVSLAKSMRNEHPLHYLVKGFVADDKNMQGRFLLGTDIVAPEALVESMKARGASTLFVTPLCSDRVRGNQALVGRMIREGIRIMMLPSAETWDGKSKLTHSQLREVQIEDLLPRDKINVDLEAIGRLMQGTRVLITGAAGSIGSEMVRQVAKFGPSEMVLVDQAETPMHDVRLYMAREYPAIRCLTIVGSIANPTHMEELFARHRPEYVFHAAAYKHVPMMEDNPAMAVQNNVYGTRVVADLAVKYGTRKFVMISTDKAVNPTNVMGCSKRICEIYCQALDREIRHPAGPALTQADGSPAVTQFITTRFGNVLGSNGSVIPIFREQIKNGGPVTVTHRDIIRYFMLIPEACQLVLEAGTMGEGGEIFVFDMGKPVRIADLAQRMIDLSGARGVKIVYTGLRDGEKLYEEVLSEAEQTVPTVHPKIKVAAVREYSYAQALAQQEELCRLSHTYDDMRIVAQMKAIVPEYKSQHSKYEALDHKD